MVFPQYVSCAEILTLVYTDAGGFILRSSSIFRHDLVVDEDCAHGIHSPLTEAPLCSDATTLPQLSTW